MTDPSPHQPDAPRFTVAIPVYNRATLVGSTIESVLAQSLTDYEIVAVNDGSADGSLDVLRRYEPRIIVIDQPNRGLSAARDAAAERARGEYLLFLDSDDLLFPWSLEVLAELVDAFPEAEPPALVSGEFVPFDDESELARFERTPTSPRTFTDYLSTRARQTGIAPSGTAVRREVYLGTGGSDDVRVMFEDVDLWFKAGGHPGYAHADAPPVAGYRVGHAQMMGDMSKQLRGLEWIAGKVERGEYPTGTERRREMQDALALHAKSCAVRSLHAKDRATGLAFYRRTLPWQIRCREWKFIAAYPLLWLAGRGVVAKTMRGKKKQIVSDTNPAGAG